MNFENPVQQPLNYSFTDIFDKEFSAYEFAKTLLPIPDTSEIEAIESTVSGNFLDDLDREVVNNEISVVEPNNFEALRTWSHVKFEKGFAEKKSLESGEGTPYNPELQDIDDVPQTEVSTESDGGTHITDLLSNFLEEENKSSENFYNWEWNSDPVDMSFIKSGGEKFFRFYYLYSYEKLFGEESSVYLFGKTFCHLLKSYKSCCVAVYPLKRRIFVLPRLFVGNGQNTLLAQSQILKEFYILALKPLNIKKFKFRFVEKRNLEDSFLPAKQIMLEIEYSATYPNINTKIAGETFSKVFGANSNCFENFVLEKYIKGPCWLDIRNPNMAAPPKSCCTFHLSCTPEQISICKSIKKSSCPPLTLLSFHIRTTGKSNNVVLISWAVNFNYEIWSENLNVFEQKSHYTFAFVNSDTDPSQLPEILKNLRRTKIQIMRSEIDLIKYFLSEFHKFDPDIVVGYDIQNDEFCKFIDRMESLKIEYIAKLSKFRVISSNPDKRKYLFSGRVICDLRHLAKEFNLSRNYELDELLEIFIGIKKEHRRVVDFEKIISQAGGFHNMLNMREEFVNIFLVSMNEPILLLKLALKTNIISLVFKLTQLSGNNLSQTFSGRVSKRNEYLLLHAFHEENFILPEKMFNRKPKNFEKGELLVGGLVLEPKAGFYENYILLMDFESLYPSIIQEYNLCISDTIFPTSDGTPMQLGVLPKLMKDFIAKRRIVKSKMKIIDLNFEGNSRYKIYETALKLCANSIYGCLAQQNFRFYCPSIAQNITSKGREVLSDSVHLLKSNGFEIIYGDTDSIMVNTKSKDLSTAQEMGQEIGKLINARYSSLNLRIDKIFAKLLILTKKKYAGIAVNVQNPEMKSERILKGLDIIRYDCPTHSCSIGEIVVDLILSDFSTRDKRDKIKEQLTIAKEDLMNYKVPKESLLITKYLSQDPKNYPPKTKYPHAQVAIRCIENSLFNFKSGDAVSFIMCRDANNGTTSQKPYHIEEFKRSNNLIIDVSYYLQKQIYPFVAKICRHIGLEDVEIEHCLSPKNSTENENNTQVELKGIEFERREPFIFDCFKCGQTNILDTNDEANGCSELLYKCINADCDYSPLRNLNFLKNKLVMNVNSYIQKYYRYEMKCTHEKCSNITSRTPLSYTKEKNVCSLCGKGTMLQIFNESDLFLQLEYFKYIFNNELLSTFDEEKKAAIESLIRVINDFQNHSEFQSVNISELFRNFL